MSDTPLKSTRGIKQSSLLIVRLEGGPTISQVRTTPQKTCHQEIHYVETP